MPIYIYQNSKTKKYIEVFQGMNDEHKYFDDSGFEWSRVFIAPNAAIDLDSNPFDQQKFLDKTQNAGTMGELWDRGQEMSDKRAHQSGGSDPLKDKYFKDYSKERKGAKHYLDD
jgi:hypothetical protein|tara:strand:- start:6657 stop:6998 length:342 start_codon:yes stop_codon:yes gene_type:complete